MFTHPFVYQDAEMVKIKGTVLKSVAIPGEDREDVA